MRSEIVRSQGGETGDRNAAPACNGRSGGSGGGGGDCSSPARLLRAAGQTHHLNGRFLEEANGIRLQKTQFVRAVMQTLSEAGLYYWVCK